MKNSVVIAGSRDNKPVWFEDISMLIQGRSSRVFSNKQGNKKHRCGWETEKWSLARVELEKGDYVVEVQNYPKKGYDILVSRITGIEVTEDEEFKINTEVVNICIENEWDVEPHKKLSRLIESAKERAEGTGEYADSYTAD